MESWTQMVAVQPGLAHFDRPVPNEWERMEAGDLEIFWRLF